MTNIFVPVLIQLYCMLETMYLDQYQYNCIVHVTSILVYHCDDIFVYLSFVKKNKSVFHN